MALNIEHIKSRLSSLEKANKPNRSDKIWKPSPGKQVVRIVPYAFNPENPFIELKFHYNMNGKTYLSPDSFNRPDPIVEFSNKMIKSGDKEEWKLGKKLEPKTRTYVPVIVRGEESKGVRFWGFGKQVYQQLLGIISDPDYGDITDPVKGRDIVVEFKTAEETGKSFPETSIRMKPTPTYAVDPQNKDLVEKLKNQSDILELFPELSYDELKGVMDAWLQTSEEGEETENSSTTSDKNTETVVNDEKKKTVASNTESPAQTKPAKSPTTVAAAATEQDMNKAFENLFAQK